jgi:pimeloyl-ACP methyl ester carboxylesterase
MCTTGSSTGTAADPAMPCAELDERRIYYELHGAGEPVLLVSGLAADHTAWALQSEYLRQFFQVLVFDNPGVGQTTGPRGPYTTALFADVAAALLRSLGIGRAHVVGASMGGMIAQQLAVRQPSLVRSLVLHCSWWRADRYTRALVRSWQAFARAAGMLELQRQIWLWVFTPRFFEERPDDVAGLERQAIENPHPQSVEAFCDQAEACIAHDALEQVREIAVPTLITVGDRDILSPPAHSQALRERIRGSTLHVWKDMGHAPFWEIPDDFNRLNHEFLEAH